MKKNHFLLLVCTLLLIFPLLTHAEIYEAVIANPSAADRLNLRKKPDESAVSLGRFYSGTPLTVMDEDEEWARVLLGNLEGYMLRQYLMPMNRNYGAPQNFYTADTTGASISLRSGAKNSAKAIASIQGKVNILGDIGDDWRYVYSHSADAYGYVRTNQLKNRAIDIPLAFLQGKTTIYADKALKKEIATYYSGTPVRVIDMARTGYARIEIYGLLYNSDFQEKAMEGYIPLSHLNVFTQPWQVTPRYETYQALSDFSFTSLYNGQNVSVPRGAHVAVIGETDHQYHIFYGQSDQGSYSTGLVKKTNLHTANRRAGITGPGRMGYACLSQPTDPEGYALGITTYQTPDGCQDETVYYALAEVIGNENGFLQLRNQDDRNFFIPNNQADIITTEQLQVNRAHVVLPGEWTAAGNDEGLWTLCVEKGQRAHLTIADQAANRYETYDASADQKNVYYTVYISAGARVTLTGTGSLYPNMAVDINSQLKWHDFTENEMIFSGSGRYFCDTQIPDHGTWFDYEIKPLPDADESYLILSHLFTENGEETKIILDEDTPSFRTNRWDLCPGTFLELHNCIIQLYYGNG